MEDEEEAEKTDTKYRVKVKETRNNITQGKRGNKTKRKDNN